MCMFFSLIILLISIIGLFICAIKFPSINCKVFKKRFSLQTFYFIPLLCALILIIFKGVSVPSLSLIVDFSLSVNPLKILILFFSVSFISMCLEEGGFFSLCSSKVLEKSKGSSFLFFILLYLIVSILTIFTSNDIVVLTFTPFICYYTRAKKINPLPFLFIEFIGANTWSMMLEIGNPTNIYLGLSAELSFIEYFLKMCIPTLGAGIVSLILVLFIFRKDIFLKTNAEAEIIKPTYDKFIIIVALIHLGACLIGLVLFQEIMYLISLGCALSLALILFIYDLITKKKSLLASFKRLPFTLIPFVLSMFVIVCSLNESGVSNIISSSLIFLSRDNTFLTTIVYGYSSLLTCNLLNNIPMSVLFSSLLNLYEGNYLVNATYASIIGSNLGALITPIGALAGIMWLDILKRRGINISFFSFIKYCALISLISALSAFILVTIL